MTTLLAAALVPNCVIAAEPAPCFADQGATALGLRPKIYWDTSSQIGGFVEVRLTEISSPEELVWTSESIPIESGFTELTGLEFNRVYQVAVTNIFRNRRSAAYLCVLATEASNLQVPDVFGEWLLNDLNYLGSENRLLYSGPVAADGTLRGRVTGTLDGAMDGMRFRYSGELLNGSPDGSGSIEITSDLIAHKCVGHVCHSGCDDTWFRQGLLVSGACRVLLHEFGSQYMPYLQDGSLADGIYEGQVGDPSNPKGHVRNFVGPFLVNFEGQGKVTIPASHLSMSGLWKDNELLEGLSLSAEIARRGRFGSAPKYYEFSFADATLTQGASFEGPNLVNAVRLDLDNARMGKFDGRGDVRPGITIGPPDFSTLTIRDTRNGESVYAAQEPRSSTCSSTETFGLTGVDGDQFPITVTNHIAVGDWDTAATEYKLDLGSSGVRIVMFRPKGLAAQVNITATVQPGVPQTIAIDDELFNMDHVAFDGWRQFEAPFVLSRLCFSKTLTNPATGSSVELNAACPSVLTMIARLYHCSE